MTSLNDVRPGHTLGRYELLVPIAQGGMAVVWAARLKGTRGFQKIVAVKSMLPALSEDPQFEEMFLAEAELASRIRHPHVCEILDLGEENGILYLVMEWIDGEPLSALQKAARPRGGVPIPIATKLAMKAALGLHAAHELKNDAGELVGLVHRDVSPQNILVTYEGIVKIVDFGVAKASESDGTHTRAGQVKGKVPFMSPEQAHGKPVDRRTDVFALGIVLYQMVTGKHPFRGENDMATLHRITDEQPVLPPRAVNTAIPPSLDAAIAQALEKDPAKRFATMLELVKALERALADLGAAGHDEDVAAFVQEVLGDRAEKRRNAIKDALRLADVRKVARNLADVSGGIATINATLDGDDAGRSSLTSGPPTIAEGRRLTATPSSATFVSESEAPGQGSSGRKRAVLVGAGIASVATVAAIAIGVALSRSGGGGPAAHAGAGDGAAALAAASASADPGPTVPAKAAPGAKEERAGAASASAEPAVDPAPNAEPVASAAASASAAAGPAAPKKPLMPLKLKTSAPAPQPPPAPNGPSNLPKVLNPGF